MKSYKNFIINDNNKIQKRAGYKASLKPYQQVEMMMQGLDPDDDFGTIDINWDDYDPNPWNWESDAQPPTLRCAHQWKATTLITSTVYDCTKCGIKKEKVDSSIKL